MTGIGSDIAFVLREMEGATTSEITAALSLKYPGVTENIVRKVCILNLWENHFTWSKLDDRWGLPS